VDTETVSGITRRNALKKIGAGAAVAWSAPTLLSIGAGAMAGSAPPVGTFTIRKSANPNPAAAGQQVTYVITVTNIGPTGGSTTFTDTNDSRVTNISAVTTNPPGGSCAPVPLTPTNFDCTTGPIAINPGNSMTFTYTANMPTSFTTGSGTGGCQLGQFPVTDTATLTAGGSSSTTVCVTGA
jgi:uncharacterized repeat protein (TIGR01451 family)